MTKSFYLTTVANNCIILVVIFIYPQREVKLWKTAEKTMDKIVALCKSRGFVYPGSEIYGGLANTWDYGPLGVELKNNIKNAWRKKFIQENPTT